MCLSVCWPQVDLALALCLESICGRVRVRRSRDASRPFLSSRLSKARSQTEQHTQPADCEGEGEATARQAGAESLQIMNVMSTRERLSICITAMRCDRV